MKKRLSSLFICFILVINCCLSAHAETMYDTAEVSARETFSIQANMPYKDVSKNAWYYDYVYDVYEKGLMTGMNETTFAPNVVLSRAHFATILWRMAGSPNAGYKAKFPDVAKGQFYTTAVMWATEKGIITGYADSGLFKPADKITREEIATMLYRYAKYSGENVSNIASLESFPDKYKVSGFAKVPMKWCVAEGIISGDGITGELIPQGDTARAVCATIISRFTSDNTAFEKEKIYAETLESTIWEWASNEVYYGYADLDEDGIDELIVSSDEYGLGFATYKVYTAKGADKKVKCVGEFYAYLGAYICEGESTYLVYTEMRPNPQSAVYEYVQLVGNRLQKSFSLSVEEVNGSYTVMNGINVVRTMTRQEFEENYAFEMIEFFEINEP